MKGARRALLDACVLIPMPLADTLLRLAEEPRMYEPYWSATILEEVSRNLVQKWKMPREKAERRESELRRHFGEALVEGYEGLIERMENDAGDRHVLAAAVKVQADVIVTYNVRHFPEASVAPWNVVIQPPSTFLWELYLAEPELVMSKLEGQAANLGKSVGWLLERLAANVPGFVARLRDGSKG